MEPFVRIVRMVVQAVLIVMGLFVFSLFAQSTTRTVTLTWADTVNPAGTTYSIYRAPGLCSGTPTFAKIATGLTQKTYADTAVAPGNYCYTATATLNGIESPQSASAGAVVTPFAPNGLSITVQ